MKRNGGCFAGHLQTVFREHRNVQTQLALGQDHIEASSKGTIRISHPPIALDNKRL